MGPINLDLPSGHCHWIQQGPINWDPQPQILKPTLCLAELSVTRSQIPSSLEDISRMGSTRLVGYTLLMVQLGSSQQAGLPSADPWGQLESSQRAGQLTVEYQGISAWFSSLPLTCTFVMHFGANYYFHYAFTAPRLSHRRTQLSLMRDSEIPSAGPWGPPGFSPFDKCLSENDEKLKKH